jgi:hypothetical protein
MVVQSSSSILRLVLVVDAVPCTLPNNTAACARLVACSHRGSCS